MCGLTAERAGKTLLMELPLSSPRTPAEYEKRRLVAAELFDQGELSQAAIARLLGVSRQAVHKW
ncbi:helix-turn-helix domain-containing protein, partial [Nocardiopsis protaetiae]|uniref:helix-turn-helix domain-containing protein n=1 Tax=Nocardiopsis protaetiae TaxID=3382270 RepID=UPI00387A96F9